MSEQTIREWLNELTEPIRSRAIKNAEDFELMPLEVKFSSFRHALLGSFIWSDTPEGYGYWERVSMGETPELPVFFAAWKNEYSKVWGDSEDIKYHISMDKEKVLCGMDKREGGLWYFGEELAKEGNDYYLCKTCLKIAKAKHGW